MASKKKPPEAPQTVAPLAVQEAELTRAIFPQFEGLGLTAKQQLFVVCYCRPDILFNGTRAYIEAYDMESVEDYMTAAAAATRLLKNVKIQKAVSIEVSRFARNHEAVAAAVMESWTVTAFYDVFDLMGVAGPFVHLQKIEDIPAHIRPLVQSIENTAVGIKVRLCDKDRAKENLAKALGLFTETQRHVDEKYETLVQRLANKEKAGNETTPPTGS